MHQQPRKRITTKQFSQQFAHSPTTLWRLSKLDQNFPTPVYILNKKLFYQDEVTTWIETQERSEPDHNNLNIKEVV